MIKAVVLGYSYTQYATWIRNRHYNRNNYAYYSGGREDLIRGMNRDTPIYFLEGWSDNTTYTKADIDFIESRFHNFKHISERAVMNEGISF